MTLGGLRVELSTMLTWSHNCEVRGDLQKDGADHAAKLLNS